MSDMYVHMTDAQQDEVLEALPDSRLAQSILNRRAEQATPAWAKYVQTAVKKGRDGEIEVDENAIVSFSPDKGAYVMAWWWIEGKEANVDGRAQRFALNMQDRGNKKEVAIPVGGED